MISSVNCILYTILDMKKITPHISERMQIAGITADNLLSGDGCLVETYKQLREYIAELSCIHPDSVLFFRGQKTDYKRPRGTRSQEGSTFLPTIYRDNPDSSTLLDRWSRLEAATNRLSKELERHPDIDKKEYEFLTRKKLAQWSILQHYEVVKTPLVDVTQSLRVACSFAVMENPNEYAYIYAFALPYPTGRISVNSEHYLTNIRLLSIIPSGVKRPHNQEGFLIGEDDITRTDKVYEMFDLRNRCVGKFKIHIGNIDFWKAGVDLEDRALTKTELYPDITEGDSLSGICEAIKREINSTLISPSSDRLNQFLGLWITIESYLKGYCREFMHDLNPTVVKGIKAIAVYHNRIDAASAKTLTVDLNLLRSMRNRIVHKGADKANLTEAILLASMLKEKMELEIPGIREMAHRYLSEKS